MQYSVHLFCTSMIYFQNIFWAIMQCKNAQICSNAQLSPSDLNDRSLSSCHMDWTNIKLHFEFVWLNCKHESPFSKVQYCNIRKAISNKYFLEELPKHLMFQSCVELYITVSEENVTVCNYLSRFLMQKASNEETIGAWDSYWLDGA